MLAVVIDPIVCHTWVGWLLPECYGVVLYGAVVLCAAVLLSTRPLLRRVGLRVGL